VGRYAIILVKFNNFITYGRGRDGNGLLLHELLENIEEDDRTPQSVAICPPDEPPGADTDRDSDLSDEEVLGDVGHLPARILRSHALVRFGENVGKRYSGYNGGTR
jgi:hypothetical protein